MTLDTILTCQAGVISRDQASGAGLSLHGIDHRLRTRRWRPVHPRVYLADGHRLDDEARVRAAVLWAGEGAVLSGVAAAWWHGMTERPPAEVGVTVDRRRPRSRAGVVVRARQLEVVDRVVHRGLAVTARPLTVVEAAVELGGAGSLLLDRALQRWVRFPQVHQASRRCVAAGGPVRAGQLLVAAADRSAAVARRLLVAMLRDAGCRGWHCGFPAHGQLIDVAFPASRVSIDVDGWAWHMDAAHTLAVRQRRAALARAGWTVLHCTWHELVNRPQEVLVAVATAIERGAA